MALMTPEQFEESLNGLKPRVFMNGKKVDKPSVRKSVSFSQNPPQVKEFDRTADDAPWYSEHKEAFVLMAVAGLSVFAFMSLRKRA